MARDPILNDCERTSVAVRWLQLLSPLCVPVCVNAVNNDSNQNNTINSTWVKLSGTERVDVVIEKKIVGPGFESSV